MKEFLVNLELEIKKIDADCCINYLLIYIFLKSNKEWFYKKINFYNINILFRNHWKWKLLARKINKRESRIKRGFTNSVRKRN